MGDRGNIVIQERAGGQIFLYTHYDGNKLPRTLQRALDRGRGRWNDESYLARIIFCEMVKGHEMAETGFGISTYVQDNEHLFLVVDPTQEMVYIKKDPIINATTDKVYTFQEFIDLKDVNI